MAIQKATQIECLGSGTLVCYSYTYITCHIISLCDFRSQMIWAHWKLLENCYFPFSEVMMQ